MAILVEEEADVKAFANYKGEEGGEKAAPAPKQESKSEPKEEKQAEQPKPKKAAAKASTKSN